MRRKMISSSFLGVIAIALWIIGGSVRSAAQSKARITRIEAAPAAFGNSDSINEQELKIYLNFLASDQLEGRNLPSRGYDVAALYIASHLAEWGLKPGGSTTSTNGPLQPYFMPIELESKQIVASESKASVTGAAPGGRGGGARGGNAEARPVELEYGKDWTALAGGRGAPALESLDVSGSLVFAGNGYVINKTKENPYNGLEVRGKIIVVAGLPSELAQQAGGGRGAGRGGAQNPLGENCVDYLTPQEYGAKNGALAVVTVANFQQLTALASANPGPAGGRGGAGLNGLPFQPPKLQQTPSCPVLPLVTAGLAMTNAIFQGEKVGASQVFYAAGANSHQDSFELSTAKKLSLHVSVHTQQSHGENVIGILEGADPLLKNEYVVISAHLDHLGLSAPQADGHNVFNGADDDGSGSAGMLAMARAYAQGAAKGIRPKRSIIFLWNAGEEKGLWGSQYFAEYPPIDLTKVVADLNMDMIGRTKGPGFTDSDPTHFLVKPGEILLVGPNISSDDLEKTIEAVNGAYQKMALNHFYDTAAPDSTHDNLGPQPNGQRIFYRSDHYNFAKMGIPIAFFTVGLHPDYHRPTDTTEKIDFKEMEVVSRTVAAVGWVLGNQEGRPHLKANLPDTLTKDMKLVKDQGWGKLTPVLAPLPGMPY